MLPSIESLDSRWYPQFKTNWDNQIFREFILTRIDDTKSVLDFGAGRGHVPHMNFKGLVNFVAGVDPQRSVFENPYLDDARILELPSAVIPYEDATFDVVFADNVMEHVSDPVTTFREIRRVLKPGGFFLAKTPNKFHYIPLIARCTPTWFHRAANRWRGRDEHDTFPTCYNCNCTGDVRLLARETGLKVREIHHIEGRPEYLRFNPLTYACGWAYERLVNSSSAFKALRCVLIFELEKPDR
jgi:SAM-dependent methyltransferase